PDLSDVTGVAQPHCHARAAGDWDADAALLAAAGARVSAVGGGRGLSGHLGGGGRRHHVCGAGAGTAAVPGAGGGPPPLTPPRGSPSALPRPRGGRPPRFSRRVPPAAPSLTSPRGGAAATWRSCWRRAFNPGTPPVRYRFDCSLRGYSTGNRHQIAKCPVRP